MNKLVVNTTNEDLVIALEKMGNVFCIDESNVKKHNEIIIPSIEKLLSENNLKIEDIDELGVVIGPGSFTGIRVGIATIKAIRDALKIKAKSINNLDYLYELANRQFGAKIVAILGSKDSYFVARNIFNKIYKYERNLTLEELKLIAHGEKIGMFKFDENLNCEVVKNDEKVLLELLDKSNDEKLVPVYYQLSQAESEKLKRGVVEICSGEIKDLDKIFSLEKENIVSNSMTKDMIENAIKSKNHKVYVSKFNGEIIGFIMLEKTDEINVESIAVDKNYRNLGIATKLLYRAKTYAKRCKIECLNLEVSVNNITAYLLYEKNGFVLRRKRKNYYQDGSDCLEMVLKLN